MAIYSTASSLEDIFERGVDKLMTFRPSAELLDAIEDVRYALDQDRYSDIADSVVTAWEYNGPMMYEQERENFAYHLIDPLLDVLNA